MTHELFSVYDTAADQFMDPFPAPTLEVAIRGFREAATTEGHQFQKFPVDYSLFHVGTFDGSLGVIEPLKARKIAMATNYSLPGARSSNFEAPDIPDSVAGVEQ